MKSIEGFKGEYRFLSNFWPCEISYNGKIWPSSEHAYMAQKTTDPELQEEIRKLPKPGDAKRLGKKISLRSGWNDIKWDVMRRIVFLKFSQNKELGEKLLATEGIKLVESNTWGDTYWGVCNGVGENNLGKILMQVRSDLKTHICWGG